MPEDSRQNVQHPASLGPPWLWPWGQFGYFLFGSALLISSLHEFAVLFGLTTETASMVLQAVTTSLLFTFVCCWAVAAGSWVLSDWRGETIHHWPQLRRVNFGLLFAIIALQMVVLGIPAISAAWQAQREVLARRPWKEHQFAAGRYHISVPASWEVVPDPAQPGTVLRLSDHYHNLSLIVYVTSKQDVPIHSLIDFAQKSLNETAEAGTEVTFSDPRLTEIQGRTAMEQELSGTFNGSNLGISLYHMDDHEDWVGLKCITVRSQFATQQPIFTRIAESIRRKSP